MERVGRAEAARWHAVKAAGSDLVGLPADPLEEVVGLLDGATWGRSHELWLWSVDDLDVAAGAVKMPVHDNLDEAEVEVTVHPSARGRGHGTAAAVALLARCRALGRPRVVAQVPGRLDGVPSAAERMAATLGFSPELPEVRRILALPASLPPVVAPPGYEVVTWTGRAPATAVPGLAELAARMSTDAPAGGLAHEPEVWDPARWVDREEDVARRGRLYLGAHASCGGEAVAYTEIGVARSQPEVAFQWDTLVRPDHRGHGLGLLLKAANLRALEAASPASRWVVTWNAASNAHMIAINDALGFRPVDRWTAYERRL